MNTLEASIYHTYFDAPLVKGSHTRTYLHDIRQKPDSHLMHGRIQPATAQLASRLETLKLKGINASLHSAIILKTAKKQVRYSEYGPEEVLQHLIQTADQAESSHEAIGSQYPLARTLNKYGRFIGFESTANERSHIETFIVTPHRAGLQVGPFEDSRFLLDGALEDQYSAPNPESFSISIPPEKDNFTPIPALPKIKIYTADLTTFLDTGHYKQRSAERGLVLSPPSHFDKINGQRLISPQSLDLDGACGTLGNLWIKALLENKGEMLKHTLLIDLPGQHKGFFLPPPVCLRYSDSSLYYKLAVAMTEVTPVAEVEHKGQKYRITTLLGLTLMDVPIRRASDGVLLSRLGRAGDLDDTTEYWNFLERKADQWREARIVDGLSHALKIKTMKDNNLKT